jgi:hypothetical protein
MPRRCGRKHCFQFKKPHRWSYRKEKRLRWGGSKCWEVKLCMPGPTA